MNRIPLSIEVKTVLKLLMYTLIGLFIAISSYFFIKMSDTAEKGYLLRENQFHQKNLESENRILKQRVLDAQSLNEVRNSNVFKQMQEPLQPIYIMPRGPLTRKK